MNTVLITLATAGLLSWWRAWWWTAWRTVCTRHGNPAMVPTPKQLAQVKADDDIYEPDGHFG